MSSSRRRLPHVYPENQWLFVTWRLAGSPPHGLYPPPGKREDAKAFVWMDSYLDTARHGPTFLRLERIATLVVESLHKGVELGHYELGAWVIMAQKRALQEFARLRLKL